jgi:hypothetical protein
MHDGRIVCGLKCEDIYRSFEAFEEVDDLRFVVEMFRNC